MFRLGQVDDDMELEHGVRTVAVECDRLPGCRGRIDRSHCHVFRHLKQRHRLFITVALGSDLLDGGRRPAQRANLHFALAVTVGIKHGRFFRIGQI